MMMLTMQEVSYLCIFMFCNKCHANCAVLSKVLWNIDFYGFFFFFLISDIYDNDSPHTDYWNIETQSDKRNNLPYIKNWKLKLYKTIQLSTGIDLAFFDSTSCIQLNRIQTQPAMHNQASWYNWGLAHKQTSL